MDFHGGGVAGSMAHFRYFTEEHFLSEKARCAQRFIRHWVGISCAIRRGRQREWHDATRIRLEKRGCEDVEL